jgi:alpha-mannosidase
MWLPDVFGYSGALPQIMEGCGIKYFATAKITWAYNHLENFPFNTFYWEGIDGTKVLAHLCNNYSSQTSPIHVIGRWKERVQKDGIASRLFPFGFGDGGGGPLRGGYGNRNAPHCSHRRFSAGGRPATEFRWGSLQRESR